MSARPITRFGRSSSGAAAIEFAMLSAPLFMLLAGAVEVSRLVWTKIALQQTAAAGARCMGLKAAACASGGGYSSGMTTNYVTTTARQWAVPMTASNVTLNNNTSCGGQRGFSAVTISYTFQSAAPHFLPGMSGGIALTATACFPNQS